MQFLNIPGKTVAASGQRAAQGAGGHQVRAGRPSQAKIDPSWKQRGERPELFGDYERGVIGKHDPAGADANGRSAAGDVANHHRCRGAGDSGHVVMLGKPVTPVSPAFGMASQIQSVGERLRHVAAFHHR